MPRVRKSIIQSDDSDFQETQPYNNTNQTEREKKKMSMKAMIYSGIGCLVLFLILLCEIFHSNNNQNIQIIQGIDGKITVRRDGGWYPKICPRIWTYSKAGIYQLDAKDRDLLDIQFKNKTTGTLQANIGYRIDGASDETLIALHQQVEGNDDKIWKMLLTALNTAAQSISTKYDPSDVIGGDKFEPMIKEIYAAIIHNPELLKHGIDVNYFAVDGRPIPDKETQKQFALQKDADLARRLAIAQKEKLEAETIMTEANYKREIAEFKGKADAETAKLKTEAEREKELATIQAQKQVEVAKLEKEKAVIEVEKQKEVAKVEAEKALAVAEVQKKTETENLAIEELKAKQVEVTARAKKVAIVESGAITELQSAEIELQKAIAQYKWDALGKGIASMTMPKVLSVGTPTGNGGSSPLDVLINALAVEKLGKLEEVKTTPPPATTPAPTTPAKK